MILKDPVIASSDQLDLVICQVSTSKSQFEYLDKMQNKVLDINVNNLAIAIVQV